jgi:hypothetical protein
MTRRGVDWYCVYSTKAVIKKYNGGSLWHTHVGDDWRGDMVKYDIETKTKHILYSREGVQFLRKNGETYMFQIQFQSKDRDKIENIDLSLYKRPFTYKGDIIDLDNQ